MPRHRKRPSEFRSLVPVLYTAPALAVLWAATSILEVVCKRMPLRAGHALHN